jgi:hypothetical protein
MRANKLAFVFVSLVFALVALPTAIVYSAGGSIEGKVTDAKGAAVAGGAVTVTDPVSNQKFSAVTDNQGHYRIEGLPPGSYSVTISAKGFSDFRGDEVKVDEGAVATLDVKLDVAPVEATVTVASSVTANSDPVYQQLRQAAKSEAEFSNFATVNNLVLTRDAAVFTLRSGEIYFGAPVEGHTTAAVFIGDGELTLEPPTPVEKHSLALFINEEKLTEPFSRLVIRFTDQTLAEIKSSANAKMGSAGPQSTRARDAYRENQQLMRKELRDNGELRTLADIYAPKRPGYFTAYINGKNHSKLLFVLDPLGIPFVSPEEVALLSYGQGDGGIWSAFHLANEYQKGTANSAEDHRLFDITRHEIDGAIKGTQITATDRVVFRALVAGRVLPFSLYPSLRVSRVQDSQGKDLSFIQESKDEDADFAVIMPQDIEPGKEYSLTVQYGGGDALRDSGGGNYILIPRSTWYPNNAGTQFGDRATFDISFRYPKGNTFIATGAPVEPDKRVEDGMLARWTSGKTELAVAGFNYGRFKKKEILDKTTGYNIEFYANEELPDSVKAMQKNIEQARAAGVQTDTTLESMTTTAMADAALADTQNATRIYENFFGKLPYTRVAMSQQPASNFGQAWPTLVFMPFTAFLDTTQRAQMFGSQGGADSFWRYVGPHEVAHQWWGHTIGWDSYHDQWMSEGFAEFSASLYVQFVRKDPGKFNDFWEAQRQLIITSSPQTRDRKPYTVGPVTQGYRLNSGKTGNVARFMIYPKGAFILHMVRMMFHNAREGDTRFQAMMKDFVQTHYNHDVSTEDFKQAIEKHMTPIMDLDKNARMDWFFNEWVYGTEIPSYKFDYQLSPDGTTISGRITQSGVSDNFKMLVPIYVDFGKGWFRLGAANITGNNSIELKALKLPQPAKRAAICALNDVLALHIENAK